MVKDATESGEITSPGRVKGQFHRWPILPCLQSRGQNKSYLMGPVSGVKVNLLFILWHSYQLNTEEICEMGLTGFFFFSVCLNRDKRFYLKRKFGSSASIEQSLVFQNHDVAALFSPKSYMFPISIFGLAQNNQCTFFLTYDMIVYVENHPTPKGFTWRSNG